MIIITRYIMSRSDRAVSRTFLEDFNSTLFRRKEHLKFGGENS